MSQNSYNYATRKRIHSISWEDFHGICKAWALGALLVKRAMLYAHTKAVHVPDYIGIITDALVLNPWDRQILQDGNFIFHPEYAEGPTHQSMEARPEMLIPAMVIHLAKG